MAGRLEIRRLRVSGLVPRDHPAPGDLAARLRDATRSLIPGALSDAADRYSGAAVLRIRRLEVDVSMLAAFEPVAFADLLARAIVAALRRAEVAGNAESGVIAYPSRGAYVAALVEAFASGRATDCWWLRGADGLRFLPRAAAIRTALLADPADGIEALASLPQSRVASVLSVLTPIEADRILDGFAAIGNASRATAEACVGAVAEAAADVPTSGSPLLLYLRAWARHPKLAGPSLAEIARVGAAKTTLGIASHAGAAARPATLRTAMRVGSAIGADQAADILFSAFGGLLLLVPTLPMTEIAQAVENPETAALVAFAGLGLCAGRRRFGAWLEEVPWRALFGLDVRAPAHTLVRGLAAIPEDEWTVLASLGTAPDNPRDARFLLLPRDLAGSRAGVRVLAGLARTIAVRFARRLIGFGDASTPFLWDNLLGAGASLRRGPDEWEARLSRPPLDVLLSLSRIVEGSVVLPSGIRVRLALVPV